MSGANMAVQDLSGCDRGRGLNRSCLTFLEGGVVEDAQWRVDVKGDGDIKVPACFVPP